MHLARILRNRLWWKIADSNRLLSLARAVCSQLAPIPQIRPAYRIQGHHIVVPVLYFNAHPEGYEYLYTLVPTGGNDPPSFGYQPNALPLSYAGIVWRSQRVTIPLLMRDRHLCVHEHLETKIYHISAH